MPHTPGPWHVGETRKYGIYSAAAGSPAVATVPHFEFDLLPADPTACDNARLIAAAPDLLRELVDFHDHTIDMGWHACEGIPGGCPVAAAVARAKGESP